MRACGVFFGLLLLLYTSACTCTDTVTISGADAGRADGSVALIDGGAGGDAGGSKCVDGDTCGDGGVCASGSCCAASSVCGALCCNDGTLCSFARCVAPGATCREAGDCAASEFCDFARVGPDAGSPPVDAGQCIGPSARTGRCLPRPPVCESVDGGMPMGAGVSCVESCRFVPSNGAFTPLAKYSWAT